MEIRRVGAAATYEIRRTVLATIDESESIPQDSDPATVHLAVVEEGRVVCVGTFTPSALQGSDARAVRLRKMGTAADGRGRGYGRALLAEAAAQFAREGFEVIWAHARTSALGFYGACEFEAVGDAFDEHGIEHVLIRRHLRTEG